MKELIRRQVTQSIATLQAVHDSQAIHDALLEISELTATALRSDRKLLVAGNGGSAADAQHLVAEFVVRLTVKRTALRAVALTTDTSILTATGNDFGYDQVFSRQIEALGLPGDIFLGISTSGNSPSILRGLEQARKLGMHTVGFSGNGGGSMTELCDYNVIIPSAITMNIQESHLVLEHIFCRLVECFIFGADFPEAPMLPAQ